MGKGEISREKLQKQKTVGRTGNKQMKGMVFSAFIFPLNDTEYNNNVLNE